ncbi:hypothetical protein DK37_08975 [Halomonas sp. SUBG004]|nr:hypothetical protein DK37_08975 [Halomonas sp. SUBG004]
MFMALLPLLPFHRAPRSPPRSVLPYRIRRGHPSSVSNSFNLLSEGGEQHIQMKLHPAELGPLSISLKMTEHGAQAHFLSAHAQVRQVLEQAIPQLRDALAEQGISLGETSVGEQKRFQ